MNFQPYKKQADFFQSFIFSITLINFNSPGSLNTYYFYTTFALLKCAMQNK